MWVRHICRCGELEMMWPHVVTYFLFHYQNSSCFLQEEARWQDEYWAPTGVYAGGFTCAEAHSHLPQITVGRDYWPLSVFSPQFCLVSNFVATCPFMTGISLCRAVHAPCLCVITFFITLCTSFVSALRRLISLWQGPEIKPSHTSMLSLRCKSWIEMEARILFVVLAWREKTKPAWDSRGNMATVVLYLLPLNVHFCKTCHWKMEN